MALDPDVSEKGSLCPGRLEGSESREDLASLSGAELEEKMGLSPPVST